MKSQKWILLSVCFLKIISFTLYIIFYPGAKEIQKFFKEDLYRKYNDHSIQKGYISAASDECSVISRDSTNHFLANNPEEKWPHFKRTRFQDYVKYLRTIDTVTNETIHLDLKRYPNLLRNTVGEENAQREIFLHLKNLRAQNEQSNSYHLSGLLSGINMYSDSMQIRLVPFTYKSQLDSDYCKCESRIFYKKENPFYYTGSLTNWVCTFIHPYTKEIQTYSVTNVE